MRAITNSLSAADCESLERDSWIDPATANAFGLYRVTGTEGAELVGRTDREDYAGLIFPVYWPGDTQPKEYFLRRDHPPLEMHNGKLKPKQKYLAPPGRGNRLLFGPGEPAEALTDVSVPILLVEGLKKLTGAWRFARYADGSPKFLVCGISGSWNWKGTIGKAPDASGTRVVVKGVIPDFDRVAWTNRTAFVLFDSDAETNEKVAAARRGLVAELRQRGAIVAALDLPALDRLDKTGFDDLLAHWGPERVLEWLRTGQDDAASVEDPEPIPLDPLNVPPFSTNVIPAVWLRDMVDATASATETPIELPLLLGLAVVATTVQRKFVVEPEQGYMEPLNIWVCPALDSGARKTSVLSKMTRPLLEFEQQHAARIAPELVKTTAARQLAEDRVKYLRQKAAKAEGLALDSLRQDLLDEEAALPDVPKALRLWAQDVTPEKLGQLMADHNEALAILSDEGGLFDILAGRYSQGVPNLDLFLQAHAGAAYRVDRGSRPSVFMNSPALTLGLSPQPAVLRGLAKTPGFRGRGLLARFFFALPHSTLGYRTLDPRPIPPEVQASYTRALFSLLALTPREDGRPHTLTFSPEAHSEWKDFQRHVEVELRDGGVFEHIRDWASKLPGGLARIAGVLHCADHSDSNPQAHPIGLPTMEAALTLGVLLEQHAIGAFSLMAVDSSLEAAQRVWVWVQRHRQATFSKRDCFQALKGTFPDMATIQPAFEILVERGYLFPVLSSKRAGRPSEHYRVNHHIAKEWAS